LNLRDLVGAYQLVCKKWSHILLQDSVWQNLCERHFQLLAVPKGIKNFQEAYKKRHILHSNLTKGVFASINLNQINSISAPLISADGKIFSGHDDCQIRIWDSNTGKPISALEGGDPIYALAYAKGQLFSSGYSGVIKVWDLNTYKCIATFEANQEGQWVSALAYADGNKLVVASGNLSLKVLDLTTRAYTFLGKLEGVIIFLKYADDKLFSGDRNAFKVWDLKKNECTMKIVQHLAVSFVYVDGMVISSDVDQNIKFWDLTTGQCTKTIKQTSSFTNCFLVYGDGIFFSCVAHKVMVWNPKTKECMATLEQELGETQIRYVYADGKLIRSAARYPEEGYKLIAIDFTASDSVIFEEIAGLFESINFIVIKNARERFLKMPLSARVKILGNRQEDSLTPKELAQAIRNYVKEQSKKDYTQET
jgi:WD40 repeat protein